MAGSLSIGIHLFEAKILWIREALIPHRSEHIELSR